jgi:hypothetical protein
LCIKTLWILHIPIIQLITCKEHVLLLQVDKALQGMEEEAERIFQDERVLLREDEAASARDTMLVQSTFFFSNTQESCVSLY